MQAGFVDVFIAIAGAPLWVWDLQGGPVFCRSLCQSGLLLLFVFFEQHDSIFVFTCTLLCAPIEITFDTRML